jgi:cytochrome c biogenesis protein ResB
VKKVLSLLKSMKLAVALLALLAAGCALATLVPQGLDAGAYEAAYGRLVGGLIAGSGLSAFFTSPLFLAPSFLFFANLSACATDRLLRELRKKKGRRHGPDLLHLGLMLLVVGSVLSFASREELEASFAPGEAAELPDGRILRLEAFEYLAYDDGRPKDWISTVSVFERDAAAPGGLAPRVERYPIRVNHPLRLGKLTVYQASRSVEGGIERTGLRSVSDPGYALVLASLILVVAALFLTFYQKLGEQKP